MAGAVEIDASVCFERSNKLSPLGNVGLFEALRAGSARRPLRSRRCPDCHAPAGQANRLDGEKREEGGGGGGTSLGPAG